MLAQARCLEEENEMLEAEILELEGRLESRTSPSSTSQRENILDLSAVVERLRKEKVKRTCTLNLGHYCYRSF